MGEFRTPSQMKDYFESKKEAIVADENLTKLVRLKKGIARKFLAEFYPLYCFSQSCYCPDDAMMRVVIGNQGYDAIIRFANGDEKKLEFTEYIYGQEEYQDAIKLNERGYGVIRCGDIRDLDQKCDDYLSKVVSNAKNKSQKDYLGVTLIFIISTFEILDFWGRDSKSFIERLIGELRQLQFKANEVYLLVKNTDPVDFIDNNIYKVK
ncbi:MAG: hypothetical protein H0Z35_03150 [Thermoanaerobacteraceae bacterium]|nr:hypothetical protein [Thermoanaerobacteraceae bacterium]